VGTEKGGKKQITVKFPNQSCRTGYGAWCFGCYGASECLSVLQAAVKRRLATGEATHQYSVRMVGGCCALLALPIAQAMGRGEAARKWSDEHAATTSRSLAKTKDEREGGKTPKSPYRVGQGRLRSRKTADSKESTVETSWKGETVRGSCQLCVA
jgi:hypothetical protein